MGSIIRDFKGNEVFEAEQETDLETKLGLVEDALEKAQDYKDEFEDLAMEAGDLVDELERMYDETVSDIEEQEEEDE